MHLEALTEKGLEVFPHLKKFESFYLAGGTALALQIGHRISVDFDLFSEKEIDKKLLDVVRKKFSGHVVSPSVNSFEELTVFVDGVKVTFLHYPFRLITDLIDIDGMRVASPLEIAAMKAYTIGRRASYKDYVDLFTLLIKNYATPQQIIKIANQKYSTEFNDRLFLEQLVLFDDVEEDPIQFLGSPIQRREIQGFLEKTVKSFKL